MVEKAAAVGILQVETVEMRNILHRMQNAQREAVQVRVENPGNEFSTE